MEELVRRLGQGATALTATLRQAQHLRWQFNRHQQAAGRRAWRSPRIEPLSAWVASAWESSLLNNGACGRRQLLSPQQSRQLWRGLLAADGDAAPALVALAEQAWRLSHDWHIDLGAIRRAGRGTDAEQFARLAAAYRARCREQQWLDRVAAMSSLLPEIAAAPRWLERELLFVGFEHWTPALAALVEALRDGGCEGRPYQPRAGAARAQRKKFAQKSLEEQTAIGWAAGQLASPDGSCVALVTPDPESGGAALRRRALDALQPGWRQMATASLPQSAGGGRPLALAGPVAAALLCLELPALRLDYQRLGQLLRSPYLAGAEAEAAGRAQLDRWLRDRGQRDSEMQPLLARAAKAAPEFAARITAANRPLGRQRRSLAAWADRIRDRLDRLGWPGKTRLDVDEVLAVEAWEALVDQFAQCSDVTEPMSWPQARQLLAGMAGEASVPERPQATGLQLLNPSEALGQCFDALWIAGLHGEAWPPPARPNPFVPIALQRAAGVPAAVPPRHARHAESLMRQLLAAAPVVVASHAERDGDERLTPSPALDSLPELAGEALAIRPSPTLKERQFAERPAMAPVADPAPPLGAGEQVSGGARILQLQAACPARAFFEVRLHAEELAVPPVGIDPLRRGQLVHRALEQLHLAMHERKLSPGEPAAAEVVTEISTRNASELLPATPLNRVLCELESTRLQFLLTELLRFDAGRPSFLTVAAERSFELVLGPLTLRLRADRVDQLADGSRLVIDYKTGGSPRSADWIGARPAEPQLPLYALAGKAQAVAIFRLNEEGLQAWGVAARDLEIPRIDPVDRITGGRLGDWRDLLAEWSANLTALANEFADGSCLIDARAPEAAAGAYASLSRLFHQAPSA